MWAILSRPCYVNTLKPRQNGRHFADDIFKRIFLNENIWIPTKISLKFVTKGSINNIPALVQIMAWRRPGDKPLSEPMMVSLLTHICVTRPQWVKTVGQTYSGLNSWFISTFRRLGLLQWYCSVAQIPQGTSPISHSAPLCNRNFCYKMVHCGIFA